MSIVPPRKKPRGIPESKTYSFEDFCILIPDGRKADLIDGVIYMASPESIAANNLNGWLYTLVREYVEYHDLGSIYFSRVAFRLEGKNGPEPDLAFVRKARLHLVKPGYVDGPPDMAMEIVSPDSIERDYVKKRELFQRFAVPEYWIVDELRERVTLLRLDSNGQFREARMQKGAFHSRIMTGFWLKPEWLWQRPLPRKNDVLALLLAGSST